MSNWKNEVQVLNSLISKGLDVVDNLRKMQHKSRELIMLSEYPTVFFVLETVFFALRMLWDERAVITEECNYMQSRLVRPIQDLLTSVQLDMENEVVLERLDTVVREFVRVQSRL